MMRTKSALSACNKDQRLYINNTTHSAGAAAAAVNAPIEYKDNEARTASRWPFMLRIIDCYKYSTT
jgi:hypothetical protein